MLHTYRENSPGMYICHVTTGRTTRLLSLNSFKYVKYKLHFLTQSNQQTMRAKARCIGRSHESSSVTRFINIKYKMLKAQVINFNAWTLFIRECGSRFCITRSHSAKIVVQLTQRDVNGHRLLLRCLLLLIIDGWMDGWMPHTIDLDHPATIFYNWTHYLQSRQVRQRIYEFVFY